MNAIATTTPKIVQVAYGDGVYTAVCDDLGLVTEAATLDALKEQVWDLAPELIDLNGLDIAIDDLRRYFELNHPALKHRVAR